MLNLEQRRKVVAMWDVLNYSHPYFDTNKELQYRHPQYIIDPHMVNDVGEIDSDESKNVNLHYWVEVLVPYVLDKDQECYIYHYGSKDKIPDVDYMHDWSLDCGGSSYENAIEAVYHEVCKKFGYPEQGEN